MSGVKTPTPDPAASSVEARCSKLATFAGDAASRARTCGDVPTAVDILSVAAAFVDVAGVDDGFHFKATLAGLKAEMVAALLERKNLESVSGRGFVRLWPKPVNSWLRSRATLTLWLLPQIIFVSLDSLATKIRAKS